MPEAARAGNQGLNGHMDCRNTLLEQPPVKEQRVQTNPEDNALPDSATYLSAIFSYCHDAIFVLDPPADRILSVNPRSLFDARLYAGGAAGNPDQPDPP